MQALRPIFALFLRSLREDTRARLPVLLRMGLVILILLIIWANQRSFGYSSAPGRQFLLMVMMLNLGFIAVAALSIFPSAITEEKEDETLTLLRMTNLSPLAILFGKSTTRLLGALLLLAVQIPFTLLAITLGGVTMQQVWGAYAILGATTFFLCNLALLASVFARTTLRASIWTGFVGTLIFFAIPLIGILTDLRRMGPAAIGGPSATAREAFFQYVIQGNPAWALVRLLEPFMGGGFLSSTFFTFSLGGGFLCFCLSWLLFDRFCAQKAEITVRKRKAPEKGARKRWAWVTRPWQRFPLAWKDFHFMIGGRFGFYVRLTLGAVIYFCALWFVGEHRRTYYSSSSWDDVAEIVLACAGFGAALELLLVTGRLFGTERQRLTLSSLVGMPWSIGKIIRQKVLGCLPVLLPWFLLALAAVIPVLPELQYEFEREFSRATFNWRNDRDELAAVVYVFLQAILLLLTIVWFSLRIRRGALPAAITVLAVWNIIFGVCVDEFARREEFLFLSVGVLLTLPAIAYLCYSIHQRIQLAAAAD